jgi:hypothetical protein
MANAGMTPNECDRQEFALMGQEKIEAAVECTQATMAGMLALQQTLLDFTFQQLLTSAAAIRSMLSIKSPAQARSTLASETLANAQGAYNRAAAARLLHPVHSRATANARRLAAGGWRKSTTIQRNGDPAGCHSCSLPQVTTKSLLRRRHIDTVSQDCTSVRATSGSDSAKALT